jgi:hypothetical protein
MPTKVDFGANRKQAEDAGLLGGGEFYKYREGDNRIRLLSECLPHQGEFQGKKNFKWLCYVLDRRDGKVKPHFMPHKVYKAIEALQTSDDYAFVEVPMPYDLTIHAKKAGTVDVEYTVMPARKEVPLTRDELAEFDKAKPLADIKQALKDKQAKKGNGATPSQPERDTETEIDVDTPVAELTDDDIPFMWLLPYVLPLTGALAWMA